MQTIYEPKGRALEYSLLALNLYQGCVHGCGYCYAAMMARRYGRDFQNAGVRPGVIEALKKAAPKFAGTDKRVLLCFSCDPYQPAGNKATREALQVLRLHDIPFQVLTKGGLRAARDFDLYGPRDAFAVTLTSVCFPVAMSHEPNAASPDDRCRALIRAKRHGIQTWVSLEPVIDPDESLEVIRQTHTYVDFYKVGTLNHAANKTDWRAFGIRAINLLEKLGKRYYVKHDLAKHLDGVKYTSIDTRTV